MDWSGTFPQLSHQATRNDVVRFTRWGCIEDKVAGQLIAENRSLTAILRDKRFGSSANWLSFGVRFLEAGTLGHGWES